MFAKSIALDRFKTLKTAEKHLWKGNLTAAITEFAKLVQANPKDLSAVNTLGDLYLRAGRTEEARVIFSRIAEFYFKEGFAQKAIAMYKKIYKLDPSNYEIGLRLGDLYAKLGRVVDAKQCYSAIAEVCKENGQMKTALEALKKIANLDSENIALRLQLAESYLDEGFNYEAYETYLQAGQDLLKKYLFADSIEVFHKALIIMHDSKPALKLLAFAYIEQGELQKAIDILSKLIVKSPDDIDILVLYGRAYLKTDMLEKAESIFAHLLKLDRSRCDYLLAVGHRHLELNQFDRAVEIVNQCVELLIAQRREEKAISLLKSVLESDAGNLPAMKHLASIYRRTLADKHLAATLRTLFKTALNQGLKEEAICAVQELTELEPYEQSYKRQLADLCAPQRFDETRRREDNLLAGISEIDLSSCVALASMECSFDESAQIFSQSMYFGIPDRWCFEETLEREWQFAMQKNLPISLILIDVDRFDDSMDDYDRNSFNCLVRMLNCELKRTGDFMACYGKKEFMVLLPFTPVEGASVVAQRMYDKANALFHIGDRISVNFGVAAAVPKETTSYASLIASAKTALNQAMRACAV